MSPKQFSEIFKAHRSKLEQVIGEDVVHAGYFVRKTTRSNGSYIYVIGSNKVLDEYERLERCSNLNPVKRVEAFRYLNSHAKVFTTQPQAVKWMEGLQ